MPQITAKEAIALINTKIGQSSESLLAQIAAEIGQTAQLATAVTGLRAMPDITSALATTQTKVVELTGLREQAETGLGNLTDVIARLGLANEIIFSVEEAPKPQKLIIDSVHRLVIRGEVIGEVPENSVGFQAVDILAGADKPLSQSEVAAEIKFTPRGERAKTGVENHTLRSSIAEVNRAMEEKGLPRLIINLKKDMGKGKGYILGDYQVLGIQGSATAESSATAQPGKFKPETFSISQVLKMEGISGILSEVQTRRLTQELLARGHLRVGEEVMEGRAQARGASSKIVRDLELTSAGVEIMRDVTNQFGAQSRIRIDDVVEWLKKQKEQLVAPVSQSVDTGRRFYISEVAEKAGIPETAIKVLHKIGALQEGIHFEQKRRVKVYKNEAFPVARQVASQAKSEKQARFTERLIRDAVGLPKEKNGENPYGPNGPKTFTVLHEQTILHRLQSCIPVIERRIGKPLQDSFKLELAARLGELTTRLSEDDKLTISSEEQGIIRRQAAATVLELSKDARSFNFLRGKHQGIEIGLAFIRGLKDQGQAKMIREFAEAIVNPPKKIADTIERNGVVNGIRTVGPMGDE